MHLLFWGAAVMVRTSFFKHDLLQPLTTYAQEVHLWMAAAIRAHPSKYTWLYESLLIGSTNDLRGHPETQILMTVGLYHLVVVSGRHVTLIEGAFRRLTSKCPPLIQNIFIFGALTYFALANRLQPACTRAIVAWVFYRLSPRVLKTRAPLFTGDLQLLVTCFCLVIEPSWVSSLSFQLSCAAQLALQIVYSLKAKPEILRRLLSCFFCPLIMAPLLFNIQPCLSWLVLPANILGYVIFSFIFLPLTLISVLLTRAEPAITKFYDVIFDIAKHVSSFEDPRLCLSQRSLHQWGFFYLGALYLWWRFLLPLFTRRHFWRSQHEIRLNSSFGL